MGLRFAFGGLLLVAVPACLSLAPEHRRLDVPRGAAVQSRRGLLASVPAAVLVGGAAVANAASDWENEFKLADANKDKKLSPKE